MSSQATCPKDETIDAQYLKDEITRLQEELKAAKAQQHYTIPLKTLEPFPAHLHGLLLLSDSALPLGSFAYSSGLESFLAHHPRSGTSSTNAPSTTPTAQLNHFLSLSLNAIISTTIPYVIAGYVTPSQLLELDNDVDASTPCTVARRASVKQGLALLAVWERSFRREYQYHNQQRDLKDPSAHSTAADASAAIASFSLALKTSNTPSTTHIFPVNGHLPPLFGVFSLALSIPLPSALYIYLLNHIKTVISAAIRAGVLGPYQAQGILAGLGAEIETRVRKICEHGGRGWAANGEFEAVGVYDGVNMKEAGNEVQEMSKLHAQINELTSQAGQSVPVMDLWGGRHEIIYSRIFNS